jgi:transposase-like protein
MARPCVTTPPIERHMAEQYAAGASIAQIADYFGCSESVVRDRLRRGGVAFRPRGRAPFVDVPADVLTRYAPGADLAALARSTGVARSTLRRALVRAGLFAAAHRRAVKKQRP